MLRENIADAEKVGGRKAVLWKGAGRRAEDLRKINDGVASDREGEFGLTFASALDADKDESACVENRSERSDPGLIVVLRAKVGEHRIRKMAFHELGAPPLPIFEEIVESRLAILVAVAAKKFAGGGRSACPRIEERDVHFALGERTIDKR